MPRSARGAADVPPARASLTWLRRTSGSSLVRDTSLFIAPSARSRRACRRFRGCHSRHTQGRTMFGLFALTYNRLGDTALALDYLRKSISLDRELPAHKQDLNNVAGGLLFLAGLLRAQGDHKGALEATRDGTRYPTCARDQRSQQPRCAERAVLWSLPIRRRTASQRRSRGRARCLQRGPRNCT